MLGDGLDQRRAGQERFYSLQWIQVEYVGFWMLLFFGRLNRKSHQLHSLVMCVVVVVLVVSEVMV